MPPFIEETERVTSKATALMPFTGSHSRHPDAAPRRLLERRRVQLALIPRQSSRYTIGDAFTIAMAFCMSKGTLLDFHGVYASRTADALNNDTTEKPR